MARIGFTLVAVFLSAMLYGCETRQEPGAPPAGEQPGVDTEFERREMDEGGTTTTTPDTGQPPTTTGTDEDASLPEVDVETQQNQ